MTINKMKFEIAMAREAVTKNVTPIVAGRIATALNTDITEIID